jgi:DNA-binding MarR family transcriptional regulator
MSDWWTDLDTAVLECLKDDGPVTPAQMAERLGMTEAAVTSLLCMLAKQRKVRICLVEEMRAQKDERRSPIEQQYVENFVTVG